MGSVGKLMPLGATLVSDECELLDMSPSSLLSDVLYWLPEIHTGPDMQMPTEVTKLIAHPFLAAFSSLSHLFTLLLIFTGIFAQVTCLHSDCFLRVCT